MSECPNKFCLDGWVDREQGTQDGRESYVDQVPCRVCGVHCGNSISEWDEAQFAACSLLVEEPLGFMPCVLLKDHEGDHQTALDAEINPS